MESAIITLFDAAYVGCGLVPNWLHSLERVGLRDRVVLYPTDRDAMDYAESTGCEVVALWPDRSAGSPEMSRYGSRGFRDVTMRKLEVVRHALSAGRTVLYSDPDVVFLRDPLPRLEATSEEIVLQSDVPPGGELSRPRWPWSRFTTRNRLRATVCAGFMWVRPTPSTLRLFDPDRPDVAAARHDQHLFHERLVWRRQARFALLPRREFPNGAWFAVERWRRGSAALDDAYILHVNWCVGERKIELLRELGLWAPDPH